MSQQPEMSSPSLALSPASTPASLPGPEDDFVPVPPSRSEAGVTDTAQPDPHPPQRIPRWLVRIEFFLRVILRICLGFTLCCAPWWDYLRPFWDKSVLFELYPELAALPMKLWSQNPLFVNVHALGALAANGAVRGIVSGLGLLNLWIALKDAIRHREE
jgi:hypothetical protein